MYKVAWVLFLGLSLDVSLASGPERPSLEVKDLSQLDNSTGKPERDPKAFSALVESTIDLMAPKEALSQPIEVTKLTPK